MDERNELISNLRRVRRAKSTLTQEQLAETAGCTRQTVIALEQGKYSPSLVLALRLAKALGVQLEEIFHLEDT